MPSDLFLIPSLTNPAKPMFTKELADYQLLANVPTTKELDAQNLS